MIPTQLGVTLIATAPTPFTPLTIALIDGIVAVYTDPLIVPIMGKAVELYVTSPGKESTTITPYTGKGFGLETQIV
jgi:hypothetical protein